MCAHTHAYVYAYVYAHMYVCMYAYMYTNTRVHLRVTAMTEQKALIQWAAPSDSGDGTQHGVPILRYTTYMSLYYNTIIHVDYFTVYTQHGVSTKRRARAESANTSS